MTLECPDLLRLGLHLLLVRSRSAATALSAVCAAPLTGVVSAPSLPSPLPNSGIKPGPFFLEITSAVDVSIPAADRNGENMFGARRCLRFSVTDGISQAVAVETELVSAFRPPFVGTKFIVRDVEMCNGILMLRAACVRVLWIGVSVVGEGGGGRGQGGIDGATNTTATTATATTTTTTTLPILAARAADTPTQTPPTPPLLITMPARLNLTGLIESAQAKMWAPGSSVLIFDARVIAVRGFSFKGGIFSLEALLASPAATLASLTARAAASPTLLDVDDVLCALEQAGAARGRTWGAWVRVAPHLIAVLSGLNAQRCALDRARHRDDPSRAPALAAITEALGVFEVKFVAGVGQPVLRMTPLAGFEAGSQRGQDDAVELMSDFEIQELRD